MKRIIFLGMIALIFSGCLLQNEKSNVNITNSGSDKIDSTIEGGELKYGTILEIPIVAKAEIEGTSFELIVDKSKMELTSIAKVGLSDENIVVSYPEEYGYKIVAYDLKNKIKADTIFVKLFLKVKGTGNTVIAIDNVKTK